MRSEARIFAAPASRLGVGVTAAHRAFGDTLLPLAHSDAFFQGGAFFQQEVPTAVRVPGPHAGSAGRRQGYFLKKTATPRLKRRQKRAESQEI